MAIKQWGYEQTNELVTLLLPYTTAYIPVGCAALLDADFSLTIQDNSSFYRPSRSVAYWFSIGKQQWGTADGTRGNFTTNLNVPYLNFYLPYASSTNTYGTDIWTVSARVETDLSKIGLSSEGNFEIIWLAIGM